MKLNCNLYTFEILYRGITKNSKDYDVNVNNDVDDDVENETHVPWNRG